MIVINFCFTFFELTHTHTHTHTHTYTSIQEQYILFHNALNATGSTSEIIRSEECIRLPVRENLEKNGNDGYK